jgi:hypothetical protein
MFKDKELREHLGIKSTKWGPEELKDGALYDLKERIQDTERLVKALAEAIGLEGFVTYGHIGDRKEFKFVKKGSKVCKDHESPV